MAKPTFVIIQTERGEQLVRVDLTTASSFQSVENKKAEHIATGSSLGSGGSMPQIIDSSSNGH